MCLALKWACSVGDGVRTLVRRRRGRQHCAAGQG
jgi:hypothetical protein